MELDSLLMRQLKNCNIDIPDIDLMDSKYKRLLELVNETYRNFEEDKKLLERSIDISSREYIEKIEEIKGLQANLVSNEKMAGIGQLSAGIAHEINNPLGFIQSNIETLSKYLIKMKGYYDISGKLLKLENKLTIDEYKDIIDEVNMFSKKNKINIVYEDLPNIISETLDGIQRIDKIVKSLLNFSRTCMADEFEEYALNKGIKDTLTIAYNEIKYHAKVEQNLEEVPSISAKPGEINQVLLNIIINAVYAIKSNADIEGLILIHTYVKDEFVGVEIRDNGCGISEEDVSHIFEPFFTTKPVGSGTGLGLSIAYDIIVNKHNGKIRVESEVGKGTTFTLLLPMKHQEE